MLNVDVGLHLLKEKMPGLSSYPLTDQDFDIWGLNNIKGLPLAFIKVKDITNLFSPEIAQQLVPKTCKRKSLDMPEVKILNMFINILHTLEYQIRI